MSGKKSVHHGGAWKVAYADFVTAMMALFMVLWISTQEREILLATSKYFQNPFRAPLASTAGVLPFNARKLATGRGSDDDTGQAVDRRKAASIAFLNSVAADFSRLLHLDEEPKEKPIDIQVTSDGLRITLFDRPGRPLFAGDTVDFTDWGNFVLQNMAWIIDRHQFRVTIDGHTRTGDALGRPAYTGWELSADRANAARRKLVFYAVNAQQVERVTGYAHTRPLPRQGADAESNSRITLSLTLSARMTGAGKQLAPEVPGARPAPTSE